MKVVAAEGARQLDKRFAFLWSAAHRLLPANAALANHMIASMLQQARASRAQLPPAVLDFVCERCGGLLVPSVSADARVLPQSRRSAANRRLARQQRRAQQQSGSNGPRVAREALATIVRVRCRRCQHLNDRAGASVVHKAKMKKRAREETAEVVDEAPEMKKLKTENHEVAAGDKVKATGNGVDGAAAAAELEVAPTSVFAPPPSPPRKLLDGPKRKKKKKGQPDAAVVAVKSSLSSFLQGLKPNARK
ncbi:RNAse P, Rpr2/Rpp21 subunit [Phytophthora cinnamomi]|uniref:RNAse P, Rpr2/Rpp21 subunit n=1 Tax=Phytophthora cinnamomi TaxID=4785 RepID=UPI00355A82BF|nr:RNAse P, Rpr2/Rpp21 subunit [Phytophthora cinnamomi]